MSKVSRLHMLCSMANSGCVLLPGSGMLPHSLQCPPAFLYLPQVRQHPSAPTVFMPLHGCLRLSHTFTSCCSFYFSSLAHFFPSFLYVFFSPYFSSHLYVIILLITFILISSAAFKRSTSFYHVPLLITLAYTQWR